MHANRSIFSEKDQRYIDGYMRFIQPEFFDGLIERAKCNLPYDRMVILQTATIRSADDKFDLPVYFTEPSEQTAPNDYFIIEVHGDPHAREFNELSFEQQFWTSRGYSHFKFNPRGSTGLGAGLKEASDGHWFDVVEDIRALVDWVKAQGRFGQKAIIMGGSFGAYAAIAAYEKGIADTVIAINGVYNLEDDYKAAPQAATTSKPDDKKTIHFKEDCERQFGRTEAIRKLNSATTYIKMTAAEREQQRLTVPIRDEKRPGTVILIAGMKDDNCLPKQSVDLYNLLAKRDTQADAVELTTMAEEGHSPQKAENKQMILRVIETRLGIITGNLYEPNGYATLFSTPGITYRSVNQK